MADTAAPTTLNAPRTRRPDTWDPARRNGAQMMADTLAQWRSMGPKADLWVFGYASLVWRPEFQAAEQRIARAHPGRDIRILIRRAGGSPATAARFASAFDGIVPARWRVLPEGEAVPPHLPF